MTPRVTELGNEAKDSKLRSQRESSHAELLTGLLVPGTPAQEVEEDILCTHAQAWAGENTASLYQVLMCQELF